MSEQKSTPPTWKPVKKGDPIPDDAVKAGYRDGDGGTLYIGKADNGEVGKYNTSNKKLNNLWAHNSGRHDSGSVFVCDPELVLWREYKNGGELPPDAFLAGSYRTDGEIYIGRRGGDRGGEVGKINVKGDGVTMNNLWCHHNGKSTSGEILCVKEQLESIVFGDLDLISETPKVAHKATLQNCGDVELVQKFKWTEQATTTESLTINVGFEYSVKNTVSGDSGILPGGKAESEVGFTLSFGVSGTISHTDQTGKEHETDVTIKPGKKVEITATLIEKKGRLPFTLRFASGKTKTGHWEGVSQSSATVITKNL